jgi:hypothetical protein
MRSFTQILFFDIRLQCIKIQDGVTVHEKIFWLLNQLRTKALIRIIALSTSVLYIGRIAPLTTNLSSALAQINH